jgi:hypothetical protein
MSYLGGHTVWNRKDLRKRKKEEPSWKSKDQSAAKQLLEMQQKARDKVNREIAAARKADKLQARLKRDPKSERRNDPKLDGPAVPRVIRGWRAL